MDRYSEIFFFLHMNIPSGYLGPQEVGDRFLNPKTDVKKNANLVFFSETSPKTRGFCYNNVRAVPTLYLSLAPHAVWYVIELSEQINKFSERMM